MPPSIPSNLGNKVTTRTTSWQDLVEKAWGSEFRAPDHDIYRFGGGARNYDSTDKGKTGLYGVVGDNLVYINNKYPDMRDGFLVTDGSGIPNGAQNNGLGSYIDLGADAIIDSSSSSSNVIVETDPYWAYVKFLNNAASFTDLSSFGNSLLSNPLNVNQVAVSDATMGATAAWQGVSQSDVKLQTVSVANMWNVPQQGISPFYAYTIEFSIKVLADLAASTNWILTINSGSYIQVVRQSAGLSRCAVTGWCAIGTSGGFTNGVWHDIAITSDELVCRAFVDGVLVATSSNGIVQNSSQLALFGVSGNTGFGSTNVQITNVRMTMGRARYGANYTVRTTPFPTTGP